VTAVRAPSSPGSIALPDPVSSPIGCNRPTFRGGLRQRRRGVRRSCGHQSRTLIECDDDPLRKETRYPTTCAEHFYQKPDYSPIAQCCCSRGHSAPFGVTHHREPDDQGVAGVAKHAQLQSDCLGCQPRCQTACVPSRCSIRVRSSMMPVVVGCPCARACSTRAMRCRLEIRFSAEKCCCAGGFPAKCQRQQVPVHLSWTYRSAWTGMGLAGSASHRSRRVSRSGVMVVAWASRCW
jgi:hypothetical protein